MLRNKSGQTITALLLDTAGNAVTTGTTTVYVTGDGGTQASGGTATHEGNGVWSFSPSAANTDYANISFVFTNAGAVSVNLNVDTVVGVIPMTATGGSSTTVTTTSTSEATADHWIGRVIVFISGTLAGQATAITDSAYVTGTTTFTVNTLTDTPTTEEFIIV